MKKIPKLITTILASLFLSASSYADDAKSLPEKTETRLGLEVGKPMPRLKNYSCRWPDNYQEVCACEGETEIRFYDPDRKVIKDLRFIKKDGTLYLGSKKGEADWVIDRIIK